MNTRGQPWSLQDWQTFYDERAAIAEHDGGLSRAEAEAQAVAETYDAIIQNERPCRGILGELVAATSRRFHQHENHDFDGVRAPAWGFDQVVIEGATYRPALPGEPGAPALIVPACEDGKIIDLVAQGLTSGRMLPRMGIAAVIGADEIEIAHEHGQPLLIFSNAMSWLKSGCRGVVIIDWLQAGYSLDGTGIIHCLISITGEIYKATRRCWPLPKIRVPEARHAA
jgi:hypothetical protein